MVQELLVIASMGTVVLNVIRQELMFSDDGVPLGLLCAWFRSVYISYFWSPEFWSGRKGFSSCHKRWFIQLFLFLCGLVAIFSGPAAALLMLPTIRSSWPAGGTRYWLSGNKSTLWPDFLDVSLVGGAQCIFPNPELVNSATLNTSGCIWHRHSSLAQVYKDWHLNDLDFNVTTDDGVARRELSCQTTTTVAETWTLGSHAAIALMSSNIADALWSAAKRYSGSLRLGYAARDGSVAVV